jgi:hypothetical protein
MRFPRPNDSQQGRSDTFVYPNTVSARGRPLDMLAMGLSSAMERENLMRVPVEVPDALPVSFSVDSDVATATPQPGTPLFAQRTAGMPLKDSTEPSPITRDTSPEMLLSPDDAASSAGTRLASSVSDFSSAPTLVNTPLTPLSRDPSSAILGGAIDSFNGQPRDRSMWKETPQQLQNLEIPQLKEPVLTPQDPTLALLTRYPLLIFLLRLMAGVLDLMPGPKPCSDNKPKNDGASDTEGTGSLKAPYPGQWPQG